MELSSSIILPVQNVHNAASSDASHPPPSQHILQSQYPSSSRNANEPTEEDIKFPVSNASASHSLYEQSYIHPTVSSGSPPPNNCFNGNPETMNHPPTLKQPTPQLSHKSTPTHSPSSSPLSPRQSAPSNAPTNAATNLIDLNSIVSYSQLLQKKEEVILALKYRSGDHLAGQALELLKAGRERVKRITAAGRAATGKPPVKHIQEQYLAVFSRFSEFCNSQNIPTWPIEPVRVAIWVLAMQEKSPPTPATLRQYITRLEFTCTVTAALFEPEFGTSSPLKGSALLRELVNRDLPGQTLARQPRSPSNSKAVHKRGRSPSAFEGEHPLNASTNKRRFEGVPGEFERYDNYLTPFSNSVAYQTPPSLTHQNNPEMWPVHPSHQPERYPNEVLHHCHPHTAHPVSQYYHPESNHHLEHHHPPVNTHPRSHEVLATAVPLHPSHRSIPQYQRPYPHEYITAHANSTFPSHPNIIHTNADGRYIADSSSNPWA